MTSINNHYTFNYSQPADYRLSLDSVFFSRKIYEEMSGIDLTHLRAIDICAGAGVVGMDFLYHCQAAKQSLPFKFDFLEVQSVYSEHFTENKKRLGPIGTQLNFLCQNYTVLQRYEYKNCYDLVVCNPPYFFAEHGKMSSSEFKNRCRFFIDSDLKNLVLSVHNCLKNEGVCFMLLRNLPEHGVDTFAMIRQLSEGQLLIKNTGDIRGTYFLQITKK